MTEEIYQTPELPQAEKTFRRGMWWIGHRERFRRIGLIVWGVVDVLLVLWFLWVMVDTFLIRYEVERGLTRGLILENATDAHAVALGLAAKSLQIPEAPIVLSGVGGRADVVTTLSNPNDKWWAEFSYELISGGTAVGEPTSGFLYPNETRPVVSLGLPSSSLSGVQFRMTDLRWHRLDAHAIPDFPAWLAERASFTVSDPLFESASYNGKQVGRSTFSVKNITAYNYWSVPFVVILRRGAGIAAVTTTTLSSFLSGETRDVDIHWLETLPTITSVEVLPTFNAFDASQIMPQTGDGATDIRTRLR